MNSPEIKVIDEEKIKSKDSFDTEKTVFQKITTNSFLKLIIRKLIFYFIVFFIAISIAFLIPRIANPNYLDLYNQYTYVTPEQKEALRAQLIKYFAYGEDLWVQYVNFLRNFFLHFDLGVAAFGGDMLIPVTEIVSRALPYTFILVIPTLIVSFFIGNWIGAWVGYKETKPRIVVYWIFIVLQAAPFYWLGYVFFDILIMRLDLFPFWDQSIPTLMWRWDVLQVVISNFFFLFIMLTACTIGGWSSGARAMMVYEKHTGYIYYGQKLGFKERKLRKYAYRNCILSQFTGLNLRFNGLIGQTLIIERLFNWPGVGDKLIQSAIDGDLAMIMGSFLIIILVIVIGNFIIDICYGILDPRIRVGGGAE